MWSTNLRSRSHAKSAHRSAKREGGPVPGRKPSRASVGKPSSHRSAQREGEPRKVLPRGTVGSPSFAREPSSSELRWQATLRSIATSSSLLVSRNCHRLITSFPNSPKFLVTALGAPIALAGCMSKPKCTVYVLRSVRNPARYYTGMTSEVDARLSAHNAGKCPHTANGRPWELDVVIEFADERRARG
jgi:putative endonuclease